MSEENKMSGSSFYMSDIDNTVPLLPADADIPANKPAPGSRFVEIGSIKTDPKINYAEYKANGKGLSSFARVTEDGRIVISLDLLQKIPNLPPDYAPSVEEFAVDEKAWKDIVLLNIVIMIVGSRGDVQPYLALGTRLKQDGHRVRIATHETFRSFVTDAGLEFFNIGGNPQDLMSYMVKNPGLIPGMESLTNGDIGRKRTMLTEMIDGCWKACNEPDDTSGRSFAADAIISNPPAFAHIHCAEALGIPLLLSFTMPWSPTTSFPHPLVSINQSNAEKGLTNYLTFALAEILTWQGIGDLVNKFRAQSLGLQPLSLRNGPALADRLKIPWTYCMSPSLIPKPDDWKNHIDIVGFYFLDLATNFTPPDDLAAFLAEGPAPVYIGFGSVVVEDSKAMTQTIFDAVKEAGVRALVSAGWGGLGGLEIPSSIFIMGNVPHDWLFDKVAAVVHHGGAGTTAIGLKKGCPTLVVPFFGDQHFWGTMIHKAGAGPEAIPHKQLTSQKLAAGLKFAISPSAKAAARRLAQQIANEDGVSKGVESFYRHLPLLNMRCDLGPSRLAVWWSTEHCLKISGFAAQVLQDAKKINIKDLDPHRSKEYNVRKEVKEPISGGAVAIFWTITNYYAGIMQIFYSPLKGIIKTTTAIPKGVMDIVLSVQEGFKNAPKLYGSSVREPGKVTDFGSGIREAGKGIFYGYYDGITGLVTEPLQGAKKEGLIGAIKGSARSFVNVTMKPAAGILGAIVHPADGAWKSAQKHSVARKQVQHQRGTRIEDGKLAVQNSTQEERRMILSRFEESKTGAAARKKAWKEQAEKVLQEEASPNEQPGSSSSGTPVSTAAVSSDAPILASTESPESSQLNARTLSEEDASFERDLEMAKQLSLAEQQGYERGLTMQVDQL